MYLNQFSVRVPEGTETASSYIEMEDGKQYTLVLRNSRSVPCDAEVSIDGKAVGTFRIYANDSIRLERSPQDDGRFTFYRLGSEGAKKSELEKVSVSDLGLIRVVFTPQRVYSWSPYSPWWTYPNYSTWRRADYANTWDGMGAAGTTITYANTNSDGTVCDTGAITVSNCAGGTGLSGHSGQGFTSVGSLDLDYSQQTTIYLRLVASKNPKGDPRPLRPAMTSNVVPPPVNRRTYSI